MIYLTVIWCLASAPFDSFDPHKLNAGLDFAIAHSKVCGMDPPVQLDAAGEDMSLEKCRRLSFLQYQPWWLGRPQNKGKFYMGAVCTTDLPSYDGWARR